MVVFYISHYRIAHAALLYALRLNGPSKKRLGAAMTSVIPQSLDSSLTIGLPVDGTFKSFLKKTLFGLISKERRRRKKNKN